MAGSVTLAAGAALVLPLSGAASAAAPTSGVLLSPGDGTGSVVAAGGTITDQTTVEVQVPDADGPNGTTNPLDANAAVKVLECADPNGTVANLPKSAASCDGLTINTGATINTDSSGGVDAFNYEVYALPSSALKEGSNSTPVCNATNECVLYIGEAQNNFNLPYVWSTPFFVAASVGTPTPESPVTIALPAAGILILGAGTAFAIRRRRRSAADVAA